MKKPKKFPETAKIRMHEPVMRKGLSKEILGGAYRRRVKDIDEEIRKAIQDPTPFGYELMFSQEQLEAKKREAIMLLTDYLSPLNDRQISNIIGIHTRTLREWRYDPDFMKMLDFEITRKKNLMRLEAYKGFFRAIRQGDTKTIRDYFKMTGDLTEEVNLNINDPSEMSKEALDQEIKDMEKQLGVKRNIRPSKR